MTEQEKVLARRCTFNLPRELWVYLKNRSFHEDINMTKIVANAIEDDKRRHEARLLKKEKAEKSF